MWNMVEEKVSTVQINHRNMTTSEGKLLILNRLALAVTVSDVSDHLLAVVRDFY